MDTERFDEADVRLTEAELTEDVLAELICLSEEWERENSCHGYRKNERADIVGNRVFLAYAGERAVGYLFGHAEKSERASSVMPAGARTFEIEELYVRPEHRGKGIGKRLFRFAEAAVGDGADYLTLSTATKNWKAILHFYIDALDMEFWSARLLKRIGKEQAQDRS